jgi:DNA-binding CsgD family transcriptional regulator
LATGQGRVAIATRLGISAHTVLTHCHHLSAKLSVHNHIELLHTFHARAWT